MKALFWLSLLVILYTYAGYPMAIALLAQWKPRRHLRASWPASVEPPVSVVMAVHNGASLIAGQLEHLLTLDPELIREVIVVSDGSSDGTNTVLAEAHEARLRKIVLPEQVGKAAALNHGIAAAVGEVLLFVDIRPRIEAGALGSLLANFADPKVGCVAGELLLHTDGHDATMAAVSGLYWKYEQYIRNCEAAWDSPVGVYGGFYAVRRALAVQTPAGTILDDMYQPLSIIRQGYRSVLDRTAFVVDRWPAKASGEFARKVRTLAGNFQLVALAPWILTSANRVVFQLVSHKLLRLVVPYFFVLLMISSFVLGVSSAGFLAFGLLQLVFWLLAFVSIRVRVPGLHRVGVPAGALLVLNAAAVVGLWRFLFTKGPLWKIWLAAPPLDAASGSEG